MNFRYKPGDAVVVRSDLKTDGKYYMRSGPSEDTGFAFVDFNMKKYCGQVVHIKEHAYKDRYFIKEDERNGQFSWVDDMFDGKANAIKFESLL